MTDDSFARGPVRPPRRHRRASSPATTGHPDAGHWTKEAPDPAQRGPADPQQKSAADPEQEPAPEAPRRVAGSDGGPESAQDRWWREQRPPHWD